MADEKQGDVVEQTLCMIKPDSFARGDEIIARLIKEGFRVVEKKQVVLTKQRAEAFYAEHKVVFFLKFLYRLNHTQTYN